MLTEPPPGQACGTAPNAPAVLDAGALARLGELDPTGKGGIVKRVMQAYVGSMDKLLPQLGPARQAKDFVAIRHVAHTLKSSSASVGALSLSGRCAQIEALIRQDRGAEALTLLDEFLDECASVRLAAAAILAG